jgi:hypothetical protein
MGPGERARLMGEHRYEVQGIRSGVARTVYSGESPRGAVRAYYAYPDKYHGEVDMRIWRDGRLTTIQTVRRDMEEQSYDNNPMSLTGTRPEKPWTPGEYVALGLVLAGVGTLGYLIWQQQTAAPATASTTPATTTGATTSTTAGAGRLPPARRPLQLGPQLG